jgi:hypothetical protein
MAESSEIPADRGPPVLERLPHSRRLRRTTRLVGIPGLIAARKAAVEAVIAALRHLAEVGHMAAEVRRMEAVDPAAGANTASRNPWAATPSAACLITIFPRPGRATFSTGPIFTFIHGTSTGMKRPHDGR